MKKTAVALYLSFLFCSFSSNAQKTPNSLLWRISGNGLQKPSYLYGTFHLTDQRLFNFGDSLYNAIEKSQGFAIEVNPDDLVPYMVDMVKKQIKNNLLIKEMMSEKEFKKYSERLSKKLNKPANEITTRDIFQEKNKWVSESYRKGKMQTFVDAYLFDIARRQGKWMGGVEDMSDQAGLTDDLIDETDIRQIAVSDGNESKAGLEMMMQAYISSNLGAIDSMMNFADSAYLDALLVKRNKKMAWRMDSLSHVRTMVFAVGAAHLPGQQGLISLLHSRGFTVEPVYFSKKIKPDDYKLQEMDIPWVNVEDPNGYYKVQMPGKPGDIEMFGLLTMKMYFNIFNGTGYLVASAATPYGQKGIDSVMSVFAENLFRDKQMKTAKSVTINGISGKELERTDEEGYKHGVILYKNSVIYMAVSFAKSNDAASLQEVKKFLASYKPMENENAVTNSYYTYTDSLLAYKVDFPSKPQPGNELSGNGDKSMNSNLMIAVDQLSGAYFIVGINQTVSGYTITNDSSTLDRIRNTLKDKFVKVSNDTTYIKSGNRVLEYNGIMKQTNLSAKMFYVFRGNRWYSLIAMYDAGKPNAAVDRFIHSFTLTPYQHAEWKTYVSADSLITTCAPAAVQYNDPKDTTDAYSYQAYRMYDATHSDTYLVIPEYLGKYYWQKDDSTLWNSLAKNLVTYKDSLLDKKYTDNGGFKGIEVTQIENGSLNATRRRMILYGDTLYTLSATLQQAVIADANVNNFFERFRFNRAAPVTHVYNSKAEQLLNGLLLKDSAKRQEAVDVLSTAPFSTADLPLLHAAILKKYPKTDFEYNGSSRKIADEIIKLKDNSSLHFARENYADATDQKIKNHLLDIISEYKTSENYKVMAGLILQSPPQEDPGWNFTGNLRDSGLLTAVILPELLPLLKDSIMAPVLINAATNLVDSNLIPLKIVADRQQDILQYAGKRYKNIKADKDSYGTGDRSLIHLLGRFNNPASNAMLQEWLLVVNDYDKINCVEELAINGQLLNAQVLLKLAADKSNRVRLYESLKKGKKEKLYPKQYLTQQAFAQSMVFTAASDDDYDPLAVTFISQKVISFKGKNARFFFYKVTYGEEEKEYKLACAGPFNMDAGNMSVDEASGNLYYHEDYDAVQVQNQISALIKDMEEWFKWKEEKE